MLGAHQQQLLETGRDIAATDWRAAKAADALTVRAWRVARIQPRRFLSPAHAIAAMAELMAARAAIDGSCSEQELRHAGFSASDVTRYAADAQVLAGAITRDRIAA